MTHLLLIDDHTIVLNGLRDLIKLNYPDFKIDEATSVKDALRLLSLAKYTLIILDYQLQDGNASDLLSQFSKQMEERPKIMILTAFDDEKIVYQCIQQGVNGILLKTSDSKKITDGIKTILDGSSYFDESIINKLIGYYSKNETKHQKLNSTECEMLDLIALGFSNKEIAERMFMSEKTIRNYLSIVYEKINVKNRTEAALYYQKNYLS